MNLKSVVRVDNETVKIENPIQREDAKTLRKSKKDANPKQKEH